MPRQTRRPDLFLPALALTVLAAGLAPAAGAAGGALHMAAVTRIAVSLVFFLHGAILPLSALQQGVRNLRLHLAAQCTTYLLFPALGGVCLLLSQHGLPPAIALGFFFMTTVSSTISSSIAMTALAGGDVGGSLFNATLSGILGVLITPAYASFVSHAVGIELDLATVIHTVALRILLPLVLGQLSRPLIRSVLERHAATVQTADRLSILLIVYGAFCDSFAAHVWSTETATLALVCVVVSLVVYIAVSLAALLTIRCGALDRPAAIAAYFCGVQKSLANGLPTAHAVFAGSASMGLIVMPLLVYHQVQLAIGALIARRLGRARGGVCDERVER